MPYKERKLSDFYLKEFRDYALYTVHHRAIPTLLDGMKPVHRKVMWTAERKAKSPIKTVSLVGYMIAQADYKHGDQSAIQSTVNMASDWRNHVPLLRGIGNFGWRLVPEAGAPRYTKVQLHPNFTNWFSDFNALTYVPGDDGELYEPECYHANVPWFFINGFRGIATGYSCFCHPRNPENMVQLMTDLLSGKSPDPGLMDVDYPAYDGIIRDGYSIGQFEQISPKKIAITSLPIEYTIDTYAGKLARMVEQGKIKDFHKTVAEGKPPFVIDLKSSLRSPETALSLRRKLNQETLTFLHDGHLVEFDDPWDAVVCFIQARLKVAERSIQISRSSREDTVSRIETKIRFVRALRDRGLEGLHRKDLLFIISGLDRTDMTESLLNMATVQMTEENIAKWLEQISHLKEDIESLGKISPADWLRYNILNKPLS